MRDGKSKDAIIEHFEKQKNGKVGVREKVEDILLRKAEDVGGRLQWKR